MKFFCLLFCFIFSFRLFFFSYFCRNFWHFSFTFQKFIQYIRRNIQFSEFYSKSFFRKFFFSEFFFIFHFNWLSINSNRNSVDVTSSFDCCLYDFKYETWNIEWILNVSNKIRRYVCVFTIFTILNEFINLFDSFLLNFFSLKFLMNNIISFFSLNFLNKCFLL